MSKRIRTPKSNDPVRPCGGCTRCCTVFEVEELSKPLGVECEFLQRSGGCGRYDTRPQACREFECMWRKGLGSSYIRPDKSGTMFCTAGNGSALMAFIESGYKGAWKRGEVGDVVKWHVDNGVPVFIVEDNKRYTLMPKQSHMSREALETMKSDFLNDTTLPATD